MHHKDIQIFSFDANFLVSRAPEARHIRLYVRQLHVDCRHLRAVIALDAGIVHSASRLLALQAVSLGVIFTALIVHIS